MTLETIKDADIARLIELHLNQQNVLNVLTICDLIWKQVSVNSMNVITGNTELTSTLVMNQPKLVLLDTDNYSSQLFVMETASSTMDISMLDASSVSMNPNL